MDNYRIPKDWYFLKMANLVSERGTCARRKVGCILINERGHVLATGYNGGPAHTEHCIDKPCPGAHLKSGEGLDICKAIHAEQNALLQCRNVYEIKFVYTTVSPCIHCVKLLLNTSAEGIITFEKYVDFDTVGNFWMDNGGKSWTYVNKEIILGKCSSSLN